MIRKTLMEKTFQILRSSIKTQRYVSFLIFYLILVLGPPEIHGQSPLKEEPVTIGLVLSGGGAQGLAHIGVLKALEEHQIPVDLIVGTSAGALVGGLYASGIPIEQLESLARDETIMKLFLGRNDLSDIPVWRRNDRVSGKFSIRKSEGQITGPPGLLNDQLLWRDLFLLTAPASHLANSNFDSLFVPFRALGADVVKQKTVVYDSGSVAEALRISMSMPMVYPPIIQDGSMIIDGGIYNNMPTDIARKLGADYIIAVNVDDVPPPVENVSDIFDFFDFFSGILFSHSDSKHISDWDYFINVDTRGFTLFDFSAGEVLIQRGYKAGNEAGKDIREIVHRKREFKYLKNRQHQFQNALSGIKINHFRWVDQKTEKPIHIDYEVDTPFAYSSDKLRDLINALYSTNGYDLIIPELSENGEVLTLKIRKKASMHMVPELRISSVDGFNISGDWDSRFGHNQYSMRSKVGLGNYKGHIDFTLSPNTFIFPYAKKNSHYLWELNTFGDYQVLQNENSPDNIYIFRSGMGLSTHFLLSWNQQIIGEVGLETSQWVNINNILSLDNIKALYPMIRLDFENNHMRRTTPVLEGWLFKTGLIFGVWDSNDFLGLRGQVKFGLPLRNKYNVSMDVSFQKTSETVPLEMTPVAGVPSGFTNTFYEDNLGYSSTNISLDFTRTIFREDVYLSVRSYNTYLADRILGAKAGWIRGGDISLKYNSILGPLELGWSFFPVSNDPILSWTKLHIYL